jgi:hypothetical protein
MKHSILSGGLLLALIATTSAADKKAPLQAPVTQSPWDLAFGAALTSDYYFRGITQSSHRPSVSGYFEPRYDVTKELQLYAGIAGASISLPNRAAAEIDLYAGVRPTFDKLSLDLGVWYYWYPEGQCFNGSIAPVFGADCLANGYLPVNGNVVERNLSYLELFAKAAYTYNDQLVLGAAAYHSPSVLSSGAEGTYISGNLKLIAPTSWLPAGLGAYWSAEVGHWLIGATDQFYCTQVGITGCTAPYPKGIPYPSYTHWNIGFGLTKNVLTLDFRYHDTDLDRGDCNAFTSDHTATFTGSFTAINPAGFGSSWCGRAFIVTGKVDLTASANLK